MKTITVKQPWAWLICSGIKPVENRTWPTKFRGRVLIHASAKIAGEPHDLFNYGQFQSIDAVLINKVFDSALHTSEIIGSVEIVDCVQNYPSIWAESSFDAFVEGIKEPIKSVSIYNWVLAKPVIFDTPINGVKGKLSFWEFELPEEYIKEIERKLSNE